MNVGGCSKSDLPEFPLKKYRLTFWKRLRNVFVVLEGYDDPNQARTSVAPDIIRSTKGCWLSIGRKKVCFLFSCVLIVSFSRSVQDYHTFSTRVITHLTVKCIMMIRGSIDTTGDYKTLHKIPPGGCRHCNSRLSWPVLPGPVIFELITGNVSLLVSQWRSNYS